MRRLGYIPQVAQNSARHQDYSQSINSRAAGCQQRWNVQNHSIF